VWTLEGRKQTKKILEQATRIRLCRHCYAAFSPTAERCPYCGWEVPVRERKLEHEDGNLEELRRQQWYICDNCTYRGTLPEDADALTFECPKCETGPIRLIAGKYDPGLIDRRRRLFLRWYSTAKQNGWSEKYPHVMHRNLFGKWPTRAEVAQYMGEGS